jgi:putative protease
MSRPEILAPAGNREMLGAAVFSGADAVYLGLTGFNARRTAGNFTPDELREAVAFCHARGVKVHVTLNTLVYDRELSGLADAVRAVAAAGADAVIADDLATAQLVKSIAPTLHLHGSTQMSVHTPEGAKELAALGYDRVILARELSLEEIRAVCEASPIEVEVFVHGALCMSVSGQCMMSAFLGGRSGNRGACAGPCRLPFDASAGLKPGQPGRACHLSLKDMDYIPHLRELMDAGVASVKIEGRLRTPEYAAAVVTACRAVCAMEPVESARLRELRDELYEKLSQVPGVRPTVDVPRGSVDFLPNIVHVIVRDLESETLILRLDMKGFGVSGGSACSSHSLEPSHVLRSIGVEGDDAYGALRISMGRYTTAEDIDRFLIAFDEALNWNRG